MTNNEETYKRAMLIVANNLIGQFPDNFKPMSAQLCNNLGNFLYDVLEGMSIEDAARKNKEGGINAD